MSDWRDDAACLDALDVDFFPAASGDFEAAREVCRLCPVHAVCLDDVMTDEGSLHAAARFGMRGGLSPSERAHAYRATTRAGRRQATNQAASAARAAIAKDAAVAAAERAEQTRIVAHAMLAIVAHRWPDPPLVQAGRLIAAADEAQPRRKAAR